MEKNFGLALGLACLVLGGAYGQSSFSQGEELFLRNKPQEALAYLESAVAENPGNAKAFLYLGVAYQQLNRLDEAIVVYRRALPLAGDDAALMAYNLGNAYYAKGNIPLAEDFYNQALAADPGYASAYLNRANAKLSRQALREAIADYESYLSLASGSSKRGRIEQLIASIRGEFAQEERERIQAEALAAAEAERKQREAEEAKARALAEAERKRRILEEVAASLQSASEETQGVSSGSEDALGYDGEFELE